MKHHFDTKQRHDASEIEIRTALVRHLAKETRPKNCILAAEAVYGFENRRADFLKLDNYSHAFEIKSDYDNTSRLRGQLAEYSKTFDFVTVVTTSSHLAAVREIAPRKVGLIVFDRQSLTPVRKPQINKQLSKSHLAAGITKLRLLSVLPRNFRKLSVAEARAEAVKKLTVKELRELFLAELVNRFSKSSAIFFTETDTQIETEDLALLRRSSRLFI